MRPEPFTKAQLAFLRETLGEGFHTAFRKATDDMRARQIHGLIKTMPAEAWASILDFVVDGLGTMNGGKA